MSIANADKVCYRHILSKKGQLPQDEVMIHSYSCNGYDKALHSPTRSSYFCFNFISAAEISKGLCIYEQRAANGLGDSPVRTIGHSCTGCNSNHDSGKDTKTLTACTSYTPALQVILGTCAWQIRSQRLLDLYQGDRSQLKPEERHCLDGCEASKKSPCSGYIDIKHVVEQTCLHKVNLDNKLRTGGVVEGLEQICAKCLGECNSRECNGSFTSVTDKHHFEVWNDLHPLAAKLDSSRVSAA